MHSHCNYVEHIIIFYGSLNYKSFPLAALKIKSLPLFFMFLYFINFSFTLKYTLFFIVLCCTSGSTRIEATKRHSLCLFYFYSSAQCPTIWTQHWKHKTFCIPFSAQLSSFIWGFSILQLVLKPLNRKMPQEAKSRLQDE
jgi:hypothetical protein